MGCQIAASSEAGVLCVGAETALCRQGDEGLGNAFQVPLSIISFAPAPALDKSPGVWPQYMESRAAA